MSDFVLNNNGATITLTNISSSTTFTVDNGFISPTLINPNLNETGESPAFNIQIPSFVSYKYNTIQPGDSITFESTNKDEILYYYNISKNPFAGIAVNVTPNEGGGSSAVLIEKTITENGIYNAVDDEADGYSTVNIEVANTYTNEDEGKVVDSGVLVAQTARETEITENGIYDTTLNNSITVNVSAPTPTPGVKSGAVIKDYDGSVIASYTPAQFAALSAYPAQPVHTGLTGQGYNWSLAGAKAYVAKYGYVEVGATYITDDGKTRYYILIQEANTEGTVSLGLNGTAVIDWGDGSETDTITGEDIETSIDTTHTYTTVGKYTITINITNGSASLRGIQSLTLGKVEVGSGVTLIPDYAFTSQLTLTSITIPEEVTSIGSSAFCECQALTSITIPEEVTSIGSEVFTSCYALTSITIPEGVTSIGSQAFYGCGALTSITIPEGVTSINYHILSSCYALDSILIPEGVTYINGAFMYCYGLTSITFNSTTSPTISSDAFNELNPFCTIYVPTGTLQTYTTAPNYPDPTIYTYVEY